MADHTRPLDPSTPDPAAPSDGSTITVREAVPSDSEALLRLLEEIMVHHGVTTPPRDRLERTLAAVFGSDSHLFLVAEEGGSILGMCALLMSISTWSADRVCEVQDVVVTTGRRGAGVGRLLLDAAANVARERGCVRLFLSAETPNLGAHAFYRSLGLQEKAVLHFERALTDAGAGGGDSST
jgi:ribosomal protein S18 acetylase RimI-like enzyme